MSVNSVTILEKNKDSRMDMLDSVSFSQKEIQ